MRDVTHTYAGRLRREGTGGGERQRRGGKERGDGRDGREGCEREL